jgi:hypothetical protein
MGRQLAAVSKVKIDRYQSDVIFAAEASGHDSSGTGNPAHEGPSSVKHRHHCNTLKS